MVVWEKSKETYYLKAVQVAPSQQPSQQCSILVNFHTFLISAWLFLNIKVFYYDMLPQGYMEEKKHSPTRTAAKCLRILCAHYWLCFYREVAIWNTDLLHPFSFSSHVNSSEFPVTRTLKPILAKHQKAPTPLMKVLKHTFVFETSNSHIKFTY